MKLIMSTFKLKSPDNIKKKYLQLNSRWISNSLYYHLDIVSQIHNLTDKKIHRWVNK